MKKSRIFAAVLIASTLFALGFSANAKKEANYSDGYAPVSAVERTRSGKFLDSAVGLTVTIRYGSRTAAYADYSGSDKYIGMESVTVSKSVSDGYHISAATLVVEQDGETIDGVSTVISLPNSITAQ